MAESPQAYYQEKLKKLADHELRIFVRPSLPQPGDIKKIHIIGVCGTAMGSLAGLLKEAGYEISGSDEECYPPMSDQIVALGIQFFTGFKVENLAGANLVIVGNFALPNNPEAVYARENSIPTLSAPEAIEYFLLKNKQSAVVAGTHGKTTTTGLLAHIFETAGKDPTYLIGGVMINSNRTFQLGKGDNVILEGDEYDSAYFDKGPKFLHYQPKSAIVTSVEFDHVDIYKDFADYLQAYKFLVGLIPEDGNLFLWGDDENVRSLSKSAICNVYYYGLKESNHISAKNLSVNEKEQSFELMVNGKSLGDIKVPLHGQHNLLNTLAVCGLSLANGLSFEKLKTGLASFKGMKRRQETVGEAGGITVIDDFAHHPTAVRETIAAIKEKFPARRLVSFFEPRSNTSRRKLFEEAYGRAFDHADKVYLSVPPLRHNDNASDFIDAEKVAEAINGRGHDLTKASYFPNAHSLLEVALPDLKNGDVVLIMSNGSFDNLQVNLLQELKDLPK